MSGEPRATPANATRTGLAMACGLAAAISTADAGQLTGRHEQDNGRLWMQLEGRRAEGVWVENDSDRSCPKPRNGSDHWGRAQFDFGETFRFPSSS